MITYTPLRDAVPQDLGQAPVTVTYCDAEAAVAVVAFQHLRGREKYDENHGPTAKRCNLMQFVDFQARLGIEHDWQVVSLV